MGTNGSTMLEPLRQGLPPLDPAAVSNAASCALPARYEAVREARQFTRRTLGQWDVGDRFDDVCLVVSELVTNALRHGGGLAGFEAVLVPDGIRLAVRDHSDEIPSGVCGPAPPPAGRAAGGYGWPLVLRLAREIEIEREPAGGKTIRAFVPIRAADVQA